MLIFSATLNQPVDELEESLVVDDSELFDSESLESLLDDVLDESFRLRLLFFFLELLSFFDSTSFLIMVPENAYSKNMKKPNIRVKCYLPGNANSLASINCFP